MDDSNQQSDGPVFTGNYPKVQASETQSDKGTAEQWSKYDLIGAKSGMLYKVVAAQQINPDLEFHYSFHPRAYLGYLSSDPCNISHGMPFNSTGTATTGCSVYAGHWLYKAGTRLAAGIGSTANTILVDNASRLSVGSYIVIYDAPAGSFNNAEHMRVTGIDRSVTPNRVTVASRGFKSTARSHGVGSIVAEHERGSAGVPENWAYNISTSGPRDSNGKTIAEVMAQWIPRNYKRNSKGQLTNVNVTGVYFDEDGYVLFAKTVDANNDLIVDNGILPDGTNVWGEGLDEFYRLVRANLPTGMRVVGGWRQTRGFEDLNGVQMENWLLAGNEFAVNPVYLGAGGIYSQLHNYNIHLNYHVPYEGYTEALSKIPTKLYPGTVKSGPNPTVPSSNANFRLGLGAALLGNGHYGRQNSSLHPDPWYDEYAVDVEPGSPTYGRAIASNPSDESAIRRHKGWLGKPLGPRSRIYDAEAFKASNSLISNGGFESGMTGWDTRNVVTQLDTTIRSSGSQSLRVLRHQTYASNVGGASVRGPQFQMVAGRQYTLVFRARAEKMREVYLQLDWSDNQGVYLIPDRWTRVVYTMTAEKSGTFRPVFSLGREETDIWFDEVYVFEGDPNVFRRDFENGIVVVNATPKARTVNLGGTFQRIRGTGQDPINNGASLSSVTIPAFDAAILVRPQSQPAPEPEPVPPPSGGANAAVGGSAWDDTDIDGVQDAGESYVSGITMQLLTCTDRVLAETRTANDGSYVFENIVPGRYKVRTVPPAGTAFSPPFVGNRGDLDSNMAEFPGQTYCMDLVDGERRMAVDAGLVFDDSGKTAFIGDRLWFDENGNGIQDSGEIGMGAVLVGLANCRGDELFDTTTSAQDGSYGFNAKPGEYRLVYLPPAGFKLTKQLAGASRAADSNPDPATNSSGCLNLQDGDDRRWFDAGFVRN